VIPRCGLATLPAARHTLSRLALIARSDPAKEVEILVLQHDVRPHSPALHSDPSATATRPTQRPRRRAHAVLHDVTGFSAPTGPQPFNPDVDLALGDGRLPGCRHREAAGAADLITGGWLGEARHRSCRRGCSTPRSATSPVGARPARCPQSPIPADRQPAGAGRSGGDPAVTPSGARMPSCPAVAARPSRHVAGMLNGWSRRLPIAESSPRVRRGRRCGSRRSGRCGSPSSAA